MCDSIKTFKFCFFHFPALSVDGVNTAVVETAFESSLEWLKDNEDLLHGKSTHCQTVTSSN